VRSQPRRGGGKGEAAQGKLSIFGAIRFGLLAEGHDLSAQMLTRDQRRFDAIARMEFL
jgi:hypothetical protein